MSTTRRQSGRLAKQRESIANAKLVATNDTDSEDEHSASEASEYGEQDRPSKRQKLVKSAPAKRTKKSSKSADKTHDLTSMPLDVFESRLRIFGHLEPKALIALARTNHIVREHLLSKGASGVWRTSRENADGPDCPEDLSEQQWVHLLYGEAWCKSCDAKNIQRVDFGLRRRACTSCLKSNLVVTSSFKRRFPDLDPSILELLPYTNIGGSAHGHASRSKFYWRADIEEMEQTLAVYERDIMMRKVDARKRLEEFKDKRIALVKSIAEHSQLCINWSSESAERRRADGDTKIAERYEAIKAKFLELGYAAADIASIKYYVRQPTALTDRIWKKIRPELEHTIVDERDRRLKQERAARIKTRIAFVQDAYKATKKSMVPTQWRHLPGLFEVVQSPAFQQVINAPDDVDVGAAHFADAVNSLPDFLVEWTVARKKHLNRLMDIALESESGTTGSPTSLPDIGRLNLATSVFKCQQDYCRGYGSNPSTYNPCIIGWDAAGAHHCDHKYTFYWPGRGIDLVETVLHFSKQGSVAAASLVALAGLGAEHATCEEMDARGLLFRCNICTPRKIPGNQVAYDVFTWRNAISHFANYPGTNHTSPSWRIFTAAEVGQIKQPVDNTSSWSCNHCPEHLDDYRVRSDVAEHVKTVHGVANPTSPTDLFRCLDATLPTPTFNVKLPPPPPAKPGPTYHCLQCSSLGQAAKDRKFIIEGVRSHLKAKHAVMVPVEGRDYKSSR